MTCPAPRRRHAAAGLFVLAALIVLPNTAWADGTRAQHDRWIHKHSVLKRPPPSIEYAPVDAGPVPQTRETYLQHRRWARKFETADGTLDGTRLQIVVRRAETDVRQLMRCRIMDQQDPELEPLAGC